MVHTLIHHEIIAEPAHTIPITTFTSHRLPHQDPPGDGRLLTTHKPTRLGRLGGEAEAVRPYAGSCACEGLPICRRPLLCGGL